MKRQKARLPISKNYDNFHKFFIQQIIELFVAHSMALMVWWINIWHSNIRMEGLLFVLYWCKIAYSGIMLTISIQ